MDVVEGRRDGWGGGIGRRQTGCFSQGQKHSLERLIITSVWLHTHQVTTILRSQHSQRLTRQHPHAHTHNFQPSVLDTTQSTSINSEESGELSHINPSELYVSVCLWPSGLKCVMTISSWGWTEELGDMKGRTRGGRKDSSWCLIF